MLERGSLPVNYYCHLGAQYGNPTPEAAPIETWYLMIVSFRRRLYKIVRTP